MKRFQRLQWKLTASYLLTSVTVLCVLEISFILIGFAATLVQDQAKLERRAQDLALIIGNDFSRIGTQQQLQATWDLLHDNDTSIQGYTAIVDVQGEVMVAAGYHVPSRGFHLRSVLPVNVQRKMISATAPQSATENTQQSSSFETGSAYVIVPLRENGGIKGFLVVRTYFERAETISELALFFVFSAMVFFVGAGIVGFAFGIVTARSIVQRLQHIATVVKSWSQGDFSSFTHDTGNDEVGELALRLNHMAQQLQKLLRVQQDAATLEERHRLARDLHDSVKQQLFAISLHISTTKALLGQNEQGAHSHLSKAEKLIEQSKRELSTLIQELRPVALDGTSLALALRDYTSSWQEQTGIPVTLHISDEEDIAEDIENAVFRIVQEALANSARHGRATAIEIDLRYGEFITLRIEDNGQGFDAQSGAYQGIGLSSMRERVQALDGQIDIQSSKGQGTTITVRCVQKPRED